MGRFVRERREFQLRIAELNKRMKAMHLEHEDSLAQLRQLKELSLPHENEVRLIRSGCISKWFVCVCMHA